MVLIGPQGTPTASSPSIHACLDLFFTIAASSGIRTSRLRTRCGLTAKRGSVASCGSPPATQNLAYWASLPAAMITWPSAHSKTW